MGHHFNIFFVPVCLFIIVTAACRDSRQLIDVDSIEYEGFIIQKSSRGLHIDKGIKFLKENEPGHYKWLKSLVRTIHYSYYYNTSYPYYDTIYLAEYALERGNAYSASVIVHELYHVMLNRIRRDIYFPEKQELIRFLISKGLAAGTISKMKKSDEEKLLHKIQLKFLLKYGSQNDIEYQRLKMQSYRYNK